MSHFTRISMISIILSLFLVFCDKNENTPNTGDPSNLVVSIDSIDMETGTVMITATADNTVEYQLFIGNADTPVLTNETGQFTYVFGDAEATYTITVRAYGTSGKYVKAERSVSIQPLPNPIVPLDSGYFSPLSYEGYNLVWQDEFNGTSVDPSNWTFETGGEWFNNELQYYRTENAWVSDGTLTIEARKELFGGHNYTSSRMKTENKRKFIYGRVDIRALLPKGQGIWPALWTLGNNIAGVGWPKCGEIDIMEKIGGTGREKTVYSTLHWDDGNGHADYGQSYTSAKEAFYEKYHVFSIIWDETSIRSFVDNQQYFVVDITPGHMSEFHLEHFFIFNVAVGGIWPGNPDASTVFPQQMKVDYIRVFQK